MTEAHELADAFNAETFKEQTVFEHAKRAEMKDLLNDLADGQIAMYRQVRPIPFTPTFAPFSADLVFNRRWKSGIRSFP